MLKIFAQLLLLSGLPLFAGAQYVDYFTGTPRDTLTEAQGGICMMGGSRESDEAMRWFLRRANGGDVLVLRASGSDGYNEYLYSELGIPVHSVRSVVFQGPDAAFDPEIHRWIRTAEAIWFAGGNQWKYVDWWRGTSVDSLIREAVCERNIAIGGTSAGMAILGGLYFSAEYGTITSEEALSNPYRKFVTVDSTRFLELKYLERVITDTHYSERDRQGRHIVFLARANQDFSLPARGIACDERTAICIEPEGLARVFGNEPDTNGYAFFLQPNCELSDPGPETVSPQGLLQWHRGGKAFLVYRIRGNPQGNRTFDLTDWRKGTGGDWVYWSVKDGTWKEAPATAPECPQSE